MTARAARRRSLLLALAAVILVLFAVHTTAWLVACRALEQGAAAAAAQAAAKGWTISADLPRRSGWPLAAEVVLSDFAVVGAPGTFPPGLAWHAQALRLRISVFAPTTLVLEPSGPQRLDAAGLPTLEIQAQRFLAEIPLRSASPPSLTMAALSGRFGTTEVGVRSGRATFPPDTVTAELNGIGIRGVRPEVDTVRLRAALTQPVPPGATPTERAQAWRAAGGAVDLSDVAIRWQELDAVGSGRILLDPQLQPQADGTLQASGLAPTLDELARAGTLPTSAATAAKAVLAILAAPAPGAPVRLPVSVKDGVLSVARFPLLRFPRLEWP